MVLFMVSNHTCLTYGFQETFMVVIPGGFECKSASEIDSTLFDSHNDAHYELNNKI